METFADVLLVTANVGSLFDNVSGPKQSAKLAPHRGKPEDYV